MSDFEVFKKTPLIAQIYEDDELLYRCWDSCKVMNTKDPDRSNNGIDTWFKYEENINTVTICARTLIRAPLIKVLAVLAEVDLMGKFVDKFDELEKVQNFSTFRWLVKIRIKMPISVTNREIYAIGFGTVIPGTDTMIMPFRSIGQNYHGFVTPPETSDYKRIDVNYGFFHIKYIDEEYCEVSNCYNIDPKVPVIPSFILNTFIKELSYYVMDDIRTKIENADPIYDQRIIEKKDFYERVEQFLKRGINK